MNPRAPLTRPPATLSPSEGEREGVRGFMGRGKHAQFPGIFTPLVWNCFMGTHVGGYVAKGSEGLNEFW